MATLEATGALEELLQQQRALVDQALFPLLEDAPLGDLLQHFQSTLLALQSHEPSFWQLPVVELIRDVLKTRVGGCVRDAVRSAVSDEPQDPVRVVASVKAHVETSSELEGALRQLRSDVEQEVATLTRLLSAGKESNRGFEGTHEHFLDQFWDKLQKLADSRQTQPKSDEEREAEGVEESESCSFEVLTFDDDLDDVSRSAMSFPCMEDFPGTVIRMQSTDALERAAALDELMQMPIVEIVHSGPIFPAACSAIVGLFLDVDIRGEKCDTAERAKKVIFDLMSQIEDAAQFLELYGAVLEFMGLQLESGKLYLDRQSLFESADAHAIAVLDCFRVLHALICRVTRHWVYFSADALARIMYSTFYLLTMYSKTETEVEAKCANPLLIMALIDDCPMQWVRLWLLNCPSTRQLFVAMEESGFVADLLQYMSRVRPLALIKSTRSATDVIEKRAVQSALAVLSYVCEYQEGREVLSRWKRVSAHTYIKQRHTSWGRPALETIAGENDSIFHSVQPEAIYQEQHEELDADYQHLGSGVVDALILSIISVIVTIPRHSQEIVYDSYDELWTKAISNSVATYLHAARGGDLIAGLIMVIDSGWMDILSSDYTTKESEENSPWFPFRQQKGITDVCHLVVGSVSKRIRSGALGKLSTRLAGLLLVNLILQNMTITDFKAPVPSIDNTKLIFESCKRVLQFWKKETWPPSERLVCERYHRKLSELITDLTSIPEAFRRAQEVELVRELWGDRNVISTQDHEQNLLQFRGHNVRALCNSMPGIRYVHDTPIFNTYLLEMHDKWLEFATIDFRELLACLSVPASAKAFFSLDGVQTTISRIIAQFRESADFTVAINSPEHECPPQLTHLVGRLRLLRCCLSTQYASSSLLLNECGPLVDFISRTLTRHVKGECMRSCDTEDTCCVAFSLVLSLVSSVPALLGCSGLLAELKLVNLDAKSAQQREVLCGDSDILGSCSLLEKQLCYEFEFVGGASERIPRCELYAFNGHSRQNDSTTASVKDPEVKCASEFIATLRDKILQAIHDGVKSGSSVPMDFVLISQASWEMVNELESKPVVSITYGTSRSAGALTEVFAKLMYSLVTSKRSRLEAVNAGELDGSSGVYSGQDAAEFFPTDSERKLMNRLYKNYASGLSLESSPTLLHCIVKKFGKAAMDCFPVTMLMILYPSYGEADILRFLSHCLATPSGCFLWPRSVAKRGDEVDGANEVSPAMLIAEGVELMLEREFPLVLRAIDKCQCSLLSLVQRWHSQSFWNYFDWENIVLYTYFSVLYGVEFQVYIMVAILKHLEPTMRELTASHNSRSLSPFLELIREPIRNFRFSQWRPLLLRLRSDYHQEVRAALFPPRSEPERGNLS